MSAISAIVEHLVLLVVNSICVVQNKPTDRQPLLPLSYCRRYGATLKQTCFDMKCSPCSHIRGYRWRYNVAILSTALWPQLQDNSYFHTKTK